MASKIILDLCGGTGAWSAHYAKAGYTVIVITLPEHDIMNAYFDGEWLVFSPLLRVHVDQVYGILFAPPCTHFTVSGAQYWPQKDADGRTWADVQIVTRGLMIISRVNPKGFWAIENPVGRMRKLLGNPDFVFDPCDFGDPYTKRTYLWGRFNHPVKNRVEPVRACSQGSWIQKLGGKSEKTKMLRSITPAGFARAFFEANNDGGIHV